MQLTVTGRHLVVSDATRQQIARKLARIDRLLNDSAVSAQCVLTRERKQVVCELTVHARGDHTLVGIGRDTRLAGAVAASAAKVVQQAERLSDRWKTRRRSSGRPQREPDATAVEEPDEPQPSLRVIRSRRYVVKPMTVDDAVLALEKGDQTFLVFRRTSSDSVAVVFRRPDGHVGLIDTEA
jgi:putative sigma-54 modulation protein